MLVTDGEQRAALAVVRSLGRAGYRPIVCARSSSSLAGVSRFAAADHAVPDPLRAPAAFATAIKEIAGAASARVIIPIAEPSVLALLDARAELLPAVLPFPSAGQFRAISDKQGVLAVASDLGIAVPDQQVLTDPAAILSIVNGARYPVVVKPARSVGEAGGERIKLVVRHAAGAEQLRGIAETLPPQAFPVLLQQRVVGPGIGVFLLRWEARIVAVFAHRRIREKPPSGGVSVYRESIVPPADLVERSAALLEHFDWQGVAMVEYKVDAASGTPYLMEVNGRFWGSLQLALDAGVDFPVHLVRLAMGERTGPAPAYRHVRSRWWWGDVDHLLARLRHSDERLGLPPGGAGRLKALFDFSKLWRPGDRSEIFRASDLRPFLHETMLWLRGSD